MGIFNDAGGLFYRDMNWICMDGSRVKITIGGRYDGSLTRVLLG